MTLEAVTLRLPTALLSDAQKLATARGVSVGEMLRMYLHAETTKPPETPVEKTIRLTTPLFEAANGWGALIASLENAGYVLKPHGMGLALYDVQTDKYVCNTAKTGFKYRKLVKRYKMPMPGHAHGAKWLPPPEPEFHIIE